MLSLTLSGTLRGTGIREPSRVAAGGIRYRRRKSKIYPGRRGKVAPSRNISRDPVPRSLRKRRGLTTRSSPRDSLFAMSSVWSFITRIRILFPDPLCVTFCGRSNLFSGRQTSRCFRERPHPRASP